MSRHAAILLRLGGRAVAGLRPWARRPGRRRWARGAPWRPSTGAAAAPARRRWRSRRVMAAAPRRLGRSPEVRRRVPRGGQPAARVLATAGASDVIVRTSDGYRMDRRAVCVDADRFVELVSIARSSTDPQASVAPRPRRWRCGGARPSASSAASRSCWPKAERLTSLRRDAVELRLAALLDLGTGGLAPDLEAAVADSPAPRAAHVAAHAGPLPDGRQAEALAAYRRVDLGAPRRPRPVAEHRVARARATDPAARPVAGGSQPSDRAATLAPTPTPSTPPSARHARPGRSPVPASRVSRCASPTPPCRPPAGSTRRTLAECLVVAAQALAMAGRACDAVAALDEAVPLARRAGADGVLATAAIVRFGFGSGRRRRSARGVDRAARAAGARRAAAGRPALRRHAPDGVDRQHRRGGPSPRPGRGRGRRPPHGPGAGPRAGRAGRAVRCAGRCPGDRAVSGRDEALCAAYASGDPTLVVAALHSVFRSTLELGDLDGLEEARHRLAAVATESLFPFAIVRIGLLDVSLALARGELAGARRADHGGGGHRPRPRRGVGGRDGRRPARSARARARAGSRRSPCSPPLAADSGAWRAVEAIAVAEAGRIVEAVALARRVLAEPRRRRLPSSARTTA